MVKTGLKWIAPLQDDLAEEKAGIPEERALPRSKPFPVTSLNNSIKGDSLDWEQVQASGKTAWEFIPTGLQWRHRLVESRVMALKVER